MKASAAVVAAVAITAGLGYASWQMFDVPTAGYLVAIASLAMAPTAGYLVAIASLAMTVAAALRGTRPSRGGFSSRVRVRNVSNSRIVGICHKNKVDDVDIRSNVKARNTADTDVTGVEQK